MVFNSRGTSDSPVVTAQFYSASFTDDMRCVLGKQDGVVGCGDVLVCAQLQRLHTRSPGTSFPIHR